MSEINKIDRFLLEYPEDNSMYKIAIKQFFKVIGENPETYFDDKENYDYREDVYAFRQYLKGKAPLTIRGYISVVKNFLIHYDVELPDKFWRGITRKIKGKQGITRYIIPNNKQLKQILQNANVKYKALFLLLSSSGMRVGELGKLKLTDIDMKTNTIYLKAEITKEGYNRITFFTPETKDALQEWLKQRDDDLQRMIKRTLNFQATKTTKDDRLFPMKYESINFAWRRLLRKAGLDEKDETSKITRMTIHTLRKYFRSRLALETPVDVVDAIIGHTEKQERVYRKYDEDVLREEYEKGRHRLYIFETEVADERLKDMEKQIIQSDNEIDYLKRQVGLLARHKDIYEGYEDMDGEEMLEAYNEINEGLDKLGKRRKEIIEKPTAKEDELQQMKKKMKDMMKQLEELEGK